MEITPGRAMYSPDEELKPLRPPKTYHPEPVAPSTLSIHAAEFVPGVVTNTIQARLQVHQRQHLQKNYQHLQPTPQQYQQEQQSYSNGFENEQLQLQQLQQRKFQQQLQQQQLQQQQLQQQQLQQQQLQQIQQQQLQQQQLQQQQQIYKQSSQNITAQMSSLGFSSVQDRLRAGSNFVARGGDGGGYYQQQQQHGNGGQQPEYQQNTHIRYKNHNQSQQHQHHQHQPQQHNTPQQHDTHNTHQNHQEQQQQQQQEQQQQQYNHSNQQQSNDSAESADEMANIALDYLQTVIQCLNQNPGQFDSIATRFNYIFEGMENNHFVLSIAMEDIFNESIINPNFRYMGAKLYNLLHKLNSSKDSLFHTLLKYKLEFHQSQVRKYIQNKEEAHVRETALFLAELYMQLRGENSRNYLIAENIVFSLKQLLSIEDNKDNIRCICLALKLAGYDLSTDCPVDMKEIIAELEKLNSRNPGKYPLANNVISLQKNNWGRKPIGTEPSGQVEISKSIDVLRDTDDPVFYGPDGREITAEECEFLTNGAAGTATSSENEEDNDDVDLDPEMDEETERDFKLFLKQSKSNS